MYHGNESQPQMPGLESADNEFSSRYQHHGHLELIRGTPCSNRLQYLGVLPLPVGVLAPSGHTGNRASWPAESWARYVKLQVRHRSWLRTHHDPGG